MTKLVLSVQEILALKSLATEIASQYGNSDSLQFLRYAPVHAHELPLRVRTALNDFRLGEPDDALCIFTGFPIDEEKIGPTPAHWKLRPPRSPVLEEEILLVLFGSLLGECIGWATQQDGHILHDIFPIPGNEGEQLGSGSEQLLWWHTEDAFHPYRGDYIGMLCLRNPDEVATTFAAVCDLERHLTADQLHLLREPLYTIRPDESHRKKNKSELKEEDEALAASYHRIESMSQAPEKIALLHGDPKAPYIRIDPYFMDKVEDPPEAQEALDALIAFIDRRLEDQVLRQGEFCFIDNFRAVHGRKPFKARYDGSDRWLKRINVVRDLRKSRPGRTDVESRIIF